MIPEPAPGTISRERPTLDYDHRVRLRIVGRHKKKLIFLALCLAIAISVYRNWGPLKHRVLWLYWFNQAMAFRMPEKPVDLRIHDPKNAAQAMAEDLAYVRSKVANTGNIPVEYLPNVYRRLFEQDSRLNLTTGNGHAVAFMGRMVRPDGTPRLVIVTHADGYNSQILNRTGVLVLPVPRWNDPLPPAVSGRHGWGISGSGPIPSIARLRSGNLDPADHAHLAFDFVVGPSIAHFRGTPWNPDEVRNTGIIDARLTNDDAMKFTIRSFTGNDPNLHVLPTSLSGDVRTLQASAGAWSLPTATLRAAPAAQPSTSGR